MLSWGAPSHLPPVLGLLIVRESHVPACDVAGATCACQWHSQWWEGENSSPACRGLACRGSVCRLHSFPVGLGFE